MSSIDFDIGDLYFTQDHVLAKAVHFAFVKMYLFFAQDNVLAKAVHRGFAWVPGTSGVVWLQNSVRVNYGLRPAGKFG